jgi:hypothetical protein
MYRWTVMISWQGRLPRGEDLPQVHYVVEADDGQQAEALAWARWDADHPDELRPEHADVEVGRVAAP